MKATFQFAWGYQGDAMNLPVASVDAALPFYQSVFGFALTSLRFEPQKAAVLVRDDVQITLVENGQDPTQDGCFFQVDDVEAAFAELRANGLQNDDPKFEINRNEDGSEYKQFFVVAPDGLCYCIGQLLK